MRRVPFTVIDLCPEPMRSALKRQRPELSLPIAREYVEGSDEKRAKMLGFFCEPEARSAQERGR